MTEEGKLYICDRCGETVFCEVKMSVPDGMSGRTFNYEKSKHWGRYDGKDLCPICTKQYLAMMNQFMQDKPKRVKIKANKEE